MDDQVFRLSITAAIVIVVIEFFFCLTLFKILERIPKEKHQFPSWFVWLFLIPYAGLIFKFMMLPFGIPNTLKKMFSTDQDAINVADTLLKLGLALAIFDFFSIFLPIHPINQIAAILYAICFVAYWVMIVRFKRKYLTL